jgi:hypothetical protein
MQRERSMSNRIITPSEKRVVLAMFAQHWENVRHIKNERLSFTNIYCLVAAGVLSLLHSVNGEAAEDFALMSFLLAFSVIGLLTSLRLKGELENALHNIETIVLQTGLEEFMPTIDLRGEKIRYPRFRWLFPVFYCIAIVGFFTLLLWRVRAKFQ